jgi:hypothetical protein
MQRASAMFLASLVAGLALLVGPAAATPAIGVTLLLRENYDFSTIDWTASAPIAESGLWDKSRLTFHGGNGNPNWAGMIKTTLTSSGGSFDMEFQGRGNGTTGAFSGTWTISHGTGAFAGIHGTGTWFEDDLSQPGIVIFPCEGQVHFDL